MPLYNYDNDPGGVSACVTACAVSGPPLTADMPDALSLQPDLLTALARNITILYPEII